MPETINLYENRRMLHVLEQLPEAPTFLRNTFFRHTLLHNTDTIDIDIVKQGRRVIPYVRPVQEGVVMERGGFETRSYKMPYIRVKRASEADKYMTRLAGDTVYGYHTPAQRAAQEFNDDLAELSANLDAEEERQAAEAIFTGKVTIRNEKGVAIHSVDFGLTNIEVLQTTDQFNHSSQNFSSILQFLRNKRRTITKTGAPAPTHMIAAPDVADVLIEKLNPPNQQSHISSIRVDRGQVDITNLPDGVTYIGFFKELGFDIYSYDGTYLDLDDTVKDYAPPGMLAMLSVNARYDRNYAAIKNFHGQFAAVPRFPHTWIENDGRARFIQLESAPLYSLHQVDSVAIVKVM
jgi:hypothetical protein